MVLTGAQERAHLIYMESGRYPYHVMGSKYTSAWG